MISFTSGNADNITEAVHGLDVFTKNWCIAYSAPTGN